MGRSPYVNKLRIERKGVYCHRLSHSRWGGFLDMSPSSLAATVKPEIGGWASVTPSKPDVAAT